MANKDNKCASLSFARLQSDHFDTIFNLQAAFQKRLGTDFNSMTCQERADFCMKNSHAFHDEVSEMMDALGGINDGIGSAVWKWWKWNNQKNISFNDLSDDDLLELKFEVVDMFHFFINFALACGMTGSELFSMYLAKNRENHNRQNKGY